MDHGFTEYHEDILCPLPCRVRCAVGFDYFPPQPTATSRSYSRAAPGYTTFCPCFAIFHLCSFMSTSHFTWISAALLNSPPGCLRSHHHHPQKFHLTSKLSHPAAHLQFNMNTLKIILVPVRSCPMFTCLGPKDGEESPNNRGIISVTDSLAFLKDVCVSNLYSLYSQSGAQDMPTRSGTKVVH